MYMHSYTTTTTTTTTVVVVVVVVVYESIYISTYAHLCRL